MGKLFDLDSPIMAFLGKIADLMILNILTLLMCIPIITAGASLTAMHYVLLKMVRKEEGYIARSFFKSFKENFKQATICWLIVLIFICIFVGDIWILNYSGMTFANGFRIALLAVSILALMAILYVFPLLARFENTIRGTFKNSVLMAVLSFPKTIAMAAIYVLPLVLLYVSTTAVPFVFLLGISGPAYLCAMLYSGTFKKFEPQVENADNGDEWTLGGAEEEKVEALPDDNQK